MSSESNITAKPKVKLLPKQQKEKRLQEALRQNLLRRKATDDLAK